VDDAELAVDGGRRCARDLDRSGVRRALEGAVGDPEREVIEPREALVREIAEAAVAGERYAPVRRTGHQDRREGVSFGIGGPLEQAPGRDAEGEVRGGGVAPVLPARGRVHDVQGDEGRRALHRAVARNVGERIGADEAGIGGVAENPVGVEREGAVRRAGDQSGGQTVAVGVRVVAEDTLAQSEREGSAVRHGVGIRRRDGRRIEHRDRDGPDAQGVARPIGEGIRAEVAGIRIVDETAVVERGERPVTRPLHQRGSGRRGRIGIRIEPEQPRLRRNDQGLALPGLVHVRRDQNGVGVRYGGGVKRIASVVGRERVRSDGPGGGCRQVREAARKCRGAQHGGAVHEHDRAGDRSIESRDARGEYERLRTGGRRRPRAAGRIRVLSAHRHGLLDAHEG